MIGRDVDDTLDVRLFLEHLPVVFVGANAARALLLAVIALHDLAGNLAAAANAGVGGSPFGLLEEAANLVAGAELAPVDVVLAVAVGIDHGDELDIRALHEPRVHLALGLQAAADLRQANHVARGDEPLTAEDAARHDGKGGRGRQPGQKRAAIDVGHGALLLAGLTDGASENTPKVGELGEGSGPGRSTTWGAAA
jgi:hypothetical protein